MCVHVEGPEPCIGQKSQYQRTAVIICRKSLSYVVPCGEEGFFFVQWTAHASIPRYHRAPAKFWFATTNSQAHNLSDHMNSAMSKSSVLCVGTKTLLLSSSNTSSNRCKVSSLTTLLKPWNLHPRCSVVHLRCQRTRWEHAG